MEQSSYLMLLAVFKTLAKAAIFQAAPGRIEPLAPPAKLRNWVFPQMVGNPPKKQPKMDHRFSRENPMGWLGYHPPFLGTPKKAITVNQIIRKREQQERGCSQWRAQCETFKALFHPLNAKEHSTVCQDGMNS